MVENANSFEEAKYGLKSTERKSVSFSIMKPDPCPDHHYGSEDVIYLNNAGQAWLDPEVQAIGREMVNYPPFVHPPADIPDQIRQLFAHLIQAHAGEIAIVPSTAFAITLAAKNIQRCYEHNLSSNGQENRNKILLLQDQMCSAVYPWQDICDQSKQSGLPLSLEVVPYPKEGKGWTEAVMSQISTNANEILVACLPPLHWSDGAILDLETISAACHANDILLVIDATQAVGIMPINIQQLRPAMLACSIHKWLRGPSGASLVYVDKSLHKTWLPLDQHGRSRAMKDGPNWESYPNEMGEKGYPEEFVHDARKFDGGGKPNPIILPMLQKSLEQLVERIELHKCQAQLQVIVGPLLRWIESNHQKFKLPQSSHVYHLMGIRPTDDWLSVTDMLEIAKRLQTEHKVYLAVRCGIFRISPYVNTTQEEMERFVQIFDEVVAEYWTDRNR
jgi:Aminotransferase class-V